MRRRLALLASLGVGMARAEAAPLVFVAPTNHAEPLAIWQGERLAGGLVYELSELLAQQLGRQAVYLRRPSRRVISTLRTGEADLLCYARPGWIGDDYHFSPPLLSNAEIVAGAAASPPLARLTDLRGERVGTVMGYRYAGLEAQSGLRRDDAPDMSANLRKLAVGRFRYAITDRISLAGARRRFPQADLRERLVVHAFDTACALSRRSTGLRPAELDAAVEALRRSGALQRLQAKYQ